MNELAEKITDSELSVMQVLWEAGESLPVTEIRRRVQQRTAWESTTVKTLIRRLCEKGVLTQEKRDVYYYTPNITEAAYNECVTAELIHRLYRGSARNLVAALVRSRDLSEEDVNELRDLFRVEGSDE